LDSTFSFLGSNSDTKDPDFIIYTGDTARHDRDKKQPRTVDIIMADHVMAVTYFTKTFNFKSGLQLFPTIGNNDPAGHNAQKPNDVSFFNLMSKIWAPYNLNLESDSSFQSGGYYIRKVNAKLSVISLNTMYLILWNSENKHGECGILSSKTAGDVMLDWFESQLKQLEKEGRLAYGNLISFTIWY
jgi:hypothetical protein